MAEKIYQQLMVQQRSRYAPRLRHPTRANVIETHGMISSFPRSLSIPDHHSPSR